MCEMNMRDVHFYLWLGCFDMDRVAGSHVLCIRFAHRHVVSAVHIWIMCDMRVISTMVL